MRLAVLRGSQVPLSASSELQQASGGGAGGWIQPGQPVAFDQLAFGVFTFSATLPLGCCMSRKLQHTEQVYKCMCMCALCFSGSPWFQMGKSEQVRLRFLLVD